MSEESLDIKSDIYSIGAVFLHNQYPMINLPYKDKKYEDVYDHI